MGYSLSSLRYLLPILILSLIINANLAFCEDVNASKPWDYGLGEGLKVGNSDIHLGGYGSIEYQNPVNAPDFLLFEDLSLFVYGDIGRRWRFFSEMEDSKFWMVDNAGKSDWNHNIRVERLYLDYIS